MTELRKRMIEDIQLAGLSQGTLEAYVRSVRQLAGHFRLSPDRITERQLRDYLIQFFFVNTLGYDWPLLTKKKSATPFANACPTSEATRTAAA